MRVDRDDRYLSEQPNKGAILSLKVPKMLLDFFKKKSIIFGLAVIITLLFFSLILFPTSNKNQPTPLTPPNINDVATSQMPNNAVTQGQDALTINARQTSSGQNSVPNEQVGQTSNQQPEITSNLAKPLTPLNVNDVSGSNNVTTHVNSTKASITKDTVGKKIPHHKSGENSGLENNLTLAKNSYSIQLTASKSVDGLKKFVDQHKITNYQIYETKRNNEKWYILIKGNYSSSEEAHKAIKSLPSALQKDKPWVKSSATINKEKAAK
ncbi:SPOR domain-containing protein [Gilliamella mensalis]|uniref:SPOR domain-containing protein n=1 Tax=Gilliamella mensalis TaxID=1908520 RepID=UPI000A153506|nr:SPOR domain-containing protein [Gilliamella mensalis]